VTRVADTWNDVYNTPYSALAALPWYTIAGAADWAGNITGARTSPVGCPSARS
jgi:hypothetical protein